jgi:hypothetical protein
MYTYVAHTRRGGGVEGYMQMCEESNQAWCRLQESVCSASRKGGCRGAKVLQEEVMKAAASGTVRSEKDQWARRDGVTEQ